MEAREEHEEQNTEFDELSNGWIGRRLRELFFVVLNFFSSLGCGFAALRSLVNLFSASPTNLGLVAATTRAPG